MRFNIKNATVKFSIGDKIKYKRRIYDDDGYISGYNNEVGYIYQIKVSYNPFKKKTTTQYRVSKLNIDTPKYGDYSDIFQRDIIETV